MNGAAGENGILAAAVGDTVTVTYEDALDNSEDPRTVSDSAVIEAALLYKEITAAAVTPSSIRGVVELTDPSYTPVSFYSASDTAVYIEVVDGDLNVDTTTADSVTVSITSDTESGDGISETVSLIESGGNTGVFRGSISLSVGGVSSADGVLAAATATPSP